MHGLLIVLFAGLQFVLFRGELWRQRGDHRKRVAAAIASMEQQARDFRLLLSEEAGRRDGVPSGLGGGGSASSSAGHKIATGAPRDREKRRALGPQRRRRAKGKPAEPWSSFCATRCRCIPALFVLPEGGDSLKCMALSSHSRHATDAALAIDAGVLGTVVKSLRPLKLSQPSSVSCPTTRGRSAGPAIGAFLGVPMLDDEGRLCGVLCADRPVARGERATSASPLPMRRCWSMRPCWCCAACSASDCSSPSSAASTSTNGCIAPRPGCREPLTLDEVQKTAFAALSEVCEFDFAALTAYDATQHLHRVVATVGDVALSAMLRTTASPITPAWWRWR